MRTSFVTSADGKRIAYDVTGKGPAIMLLHGGGGGHSRQSWHEVGYVERLRNDFKVITMDIRGHGQSDKPLAPSAYSIDRMCHDILAVADACSVQEFAIWGFSFGGNIGRFLAVRSDRVTRIIIIGIPMGPAASGDFRDFIQEFRTHWEPILPGLQDGTLDITSLSDEDQRSLQRADVPVMLAWLTAMLDWGAVEPTELPCPTLWLSGSENESTMASIRAHGDVLPASNVQVHILAGLTHLQEFGEIDQVLPIMVNFTTAP